MLLPTLPEIIKECGTGDFAQSMNASKMNLAMELCKMFPKPYFTVDNKDWLNPT